MRGGLGLLAGIASWRGKSVKVDGVDGADCVDQVDRIGRC